MISIVIASKNEGNEIYDTIEAINKTCDVPYEIVVVDDFSNEPIKSEDAVVLRNELPLGVHQSINKGIEAAKYDNIAIFNARMRFPDKKWASKMIKHLMNNQKTLFCTRSGVLTFDNKEKANSYRYGADILLNHEENGAYESFTPKWKKQKKGNVYEIPCVLGANYFIRKGLWKYIKGFQLLNGYGGLCAYLSLKIWVMGGNVKIAKDVTINNIYYSKGEKKPYIADKFDYYWNRVITGYLFLDWKEAENIMFRYKDNPNYELIKNRLIHDMDEIIKVRNYIQKNKIFDINCVIKK